MEDFPIEILKSVMKFEKQLDKLLQRRGAARITAREELVAYFGHTVNAEQIRRERMKGTALKEMWRSELNKRMNTLDDNMQIMQDKIILLKDWAKMRSTEEEYSDLLVQLKGVVATGEPYDMGPHIKECMDELERANLTSESV